MGVHWEVVGGLLGVSKGCKNHGLIGPGGYWRGLKVFLWNSLMFLTLKKQIVYLYLQVNDLESQFCSTFHQKMWQIILHSRTVL